MSAFRVTATGRGRGYCGCVIKKGETYYIQKYNRSSVLHSFCSKCFGAKKGEEITSITPDEVKFIGSRLLK